MFPIRDHNPSETQPVITIFLIMANVIVFLSYSALFSDERALSEFIYAWAMIPGRISGGHGYYTVLTSMFMHAGLLHLVGNMLFLWIFGDNLEDELGHIGFLVFYLFSGVMAAMAQWLAFPYADIPMIGASGAIAGVMGGYLLLFPRARVDVLFVFIVFFRIFPVPAWVVLGIWFAMQMFSGIGVDPNSGGVAYWAHAGGFLAGFLVVFPLWLRRGGTDFWRETKGHPPNPAARYRVVRSNIPRAGRHH